MKQVGYYPRTPFCNVQLHPKKYFDADNGIFIRDKMEKILSYSLRDIIDDSVHNNMSYVDWNDVLGGHHPSRFLPKDNDFDME